MRLRISILPQTIDRELSDDEFKRYLELKDKVDSGEVDDWQLENFWDCDLSNVDAEKEWEVIE